MLTKESPFQNTLFYLNVFNGALIIFPFLHYVGPIKKTKIKIEVLEGGPICFHSLLMNPGPPSSFFYILEAQGFIKEENIIMGPQDSIISL